MLKFLPFENKCLKKLQKYTMQSPYYNCDFSAGVLYMWNDIYNLSYAEYNSSLILKCNFLNKKTVRFSRFLFCIIIVKSFLGSDLSINESNNGPRFFKKYLQYADMLRVDNIDLKFTDEAIKVIAEMSEIMNATSEDIGARRLHTVMETLIEDISYNADGTNPMTEVIIDKKYVTDKLGVTTKEKDLKKYIL